MRLADALVQFLRKSCFVHTALRQTDTQTNRRTTSSPKAPASTSQYNKTPWRLKTFTQLKRKLMSEKARHRALLSTRQFVVEERDKRVYTETNQCIQKHHHRTRQSRGTINPLECRGNYSATPNNMKLVHWPWMGRMLHLIQRGARPGPSSLYQM